LIFKETETINISQYLIGNIDKWLLSILSKKETKHVKKYNLLQIFNIILNTEISFTLH